MALKGQLGGPSGGRKMIDFKGKLGLFPSSQGGAGEPPGDDEYPLGKGIWSTFKGPSAAPTAAHLPHLQGRLTPLASHTIPSEGRTRPPHH